MKNLITSILLIVCILSGAVDLTGCGIKGEITQAAEVATEQESNGSAATPYFAESQPIYVYVCGAVMTPGVYELQEGARAYEAVEAAGGFSEDACEGEVNLAEELSDGQQVKIPTFAEVYAAQQQMLSGTDSDGRINLNTASKEQLMTLPGIGESKADAIISYRSKNGGFTSAEDVMNISGIKEGLYAQIREMICV